jgi:hypothetical protein
MEEEVFRLKGEGWTNKEIAGHYELGKVQLKNLITRHNQRQKKIEAGHTPRKRGRPRKNDPTTHQEKDYEIKRLKMENELLRDFLRGIGRG